MRCGRWRPRSPRRCRRGRRQRRGRPRRWGRWRRGQAGAGATGSAGGRVHRDDLAIAGRGKQATVTIGKAAARQGAGVELGLRFFCHRTPPVRATAVTVAMWRPSRRRGHRQRWAACDAGAAVCCLHRCSPSRHAGVRQTAAPCGGTWRALLRAAPSRRRPGCRAATPGTDRFAGMLVVSTGGGLAFLRDRGRQVGARIEAFAGQDHFLLAQLWPQAAATTAATRPITPARRMARPIVRRRRGADRGRRSGGGRGQFRHPAR